MPRTGRGVVWRRVLRYVPNNVKNRWRMEDMQHGDHGFKPMRERGSGLSSR